jgi:GntR family transcriptional regulator / MocR family aminotransferase
VPRRAIVTRRPEIELDAASEMPLYKQLYERLRSAILTGQLEGGAPLPSTRALAHELGVSRTTTILAYEQLVLEGYLESRKGQGTSVACQLPAFLAYRRTTSTPSTRMDTGVPVVRLAARVRSLQQMPYPKRVGQRSSGVFRGGEPALDLFPYDVWARLIARHARQSLRAYAHYQPPTGYEPLRAAIAAHIGITRGVRCTPEQIILTAGSQGALDLAARTLLDPGEAAWLENPGYFGARGALLAAGARLVPVPVDEQGLMVEIGQQRCPLARLVSTSPSNQAPTGVTMSLSRRLALLDWAREAGAWILEDDYDSEYRFGGRPLEALQGLDHAGQVLYIGTFSKVLFPSLRLGYLVAPSDLIEPLLAVRRCIDGYPPMLEQMALCDFLTEGHYARHLRQMLSLYRRRRDLLRHELHLHLGGLLEVHLPEAGMHLVGWLPPGKDDQRAAELAAGAGIEVIAISRYCLEPLPRGGLVFGYASANEEATASGVKRLAAVLEQL